MNTFATGNETFILTTNDVDDSCTTTITIDDISIVDITDIIEEDNWSINTYADIFNFRDLIKDIRTLAEEIYLYKYLLHELYMEYRYHLILKSFFNVYFVLLCRKQPLTISGYVAFVGKRMKGKL